MNRAVRAVLSWSLCFVVAFPSAVAQEAVEPGPALDRLLALEPSELAAYIAELKTRAAEAEAKAAALAEQAQAKTQEAEAFAAHVAARAEALEALAKALGEAPDEAAAMMEGGAMEEMAEEEGGESEAPKLTYADHIRPIFQSNCMQCHNLDRARGGLNLDSYEAMMEGGSSGQVIAPGDPDGSRLYRLVTQSEEPVMPPSGLPLGEADLDTIREWLALGAPKDSDSEVMEAKTIGVDLAAVGDAFQVDGPPPMPETTLEPANAPGDNDPTARVLAASPTAPLLAAASYRQVLLFNAETLECLGALPFDEGEVFALTFSRSGEYLLAAGGVEGASGRAVLWNVRTAEKLNTYGEAYDAYLAADISPDNATIALGGPSAKVRTYATATGEMRYELDAHSDWIYALRYSHDGELLASADRAGGLFLWQAANGRPVEQLRGHTGPIYQLTYSADSVYMASAGEDGTVQIWDTWAYSRVRSITAHGGPALSVHFSRAGELLSSGADGQVRRWDLQGQHLGDLPRQPDWTYAARYIRGDELVVAARWDGAIQVWYRESAEPVAEWTTDPEPGAPQVAQNEGE